MDPSTPLRGLTFLNTRDARSAPALTRLLAENGAEVVECPTIEFIPPRSWKPFDTRLECISSDDWIVFTSATAVRATLERLWDLNRPPGTLGQARIAVIGEGTASAVHAEKLNVDLMPGISQQEALLAALLSRLERRDKVWIPRAQEAREVLVNGLRKGGTEVVVTPVYRTAVPKDGLQAALGPLKSGGIDWLLFTSTSTVNHFFELLDADSRAQLAQRWPQVACLGAVTAEAARRKGLPVAVVPSRQDIQGMVDAILGAIVSDSAEGDPADGDSEGGGVEEEA